MPRNSDGLYSLPSGTTVTTGDTLLVTQHNPPFLDVASALTDSLSRSGNGGMQADLAMGSNKITGMAPGTDPTDAATVSQLISGAGVPIGCVMDFAGSTPPDGWLACAGQAISRSTYADLFTAIGTTYGTGDGTTTFNLPDCRGRVTAGRDIDSGGTANRLTNATMTPNGTTLGAVGGAQTQTLTTAQIPAHTHTGTAASNGAHTHDYSKANLVFLADGGATSVFRSTDVGATTGSAGAHTHSLTIDNAGGGEAHPNVQPTILMNKIIKATS